MSQTQARRPYPSREKAVPSARFGIPSSVAAIQAVLIVLMVHHGWHAWDHQIISLRGDSSIYLWFLSWWGHALTHGLSLGVTHLVSNPWGNNVLWDTSVPLVFIPLSLGVHLHVLTLSLAYNLALFGGWWFSGFAAYWSYQKITERPIASGLAATLTLTSAYFTNQALGHTDLLWVGFAFIIFAVLYEFTQNAPPLRWLIWRVVPLTLALWLTNEEFFVTTQIMVALGLYGLIHQALYRRMEWTAVWRVVRSYVLCVGVAVMLLSPLIGWQLTTPDQPFHAFSYVNVYQINAANFLIPVHTWIHWGSQVALSGNVMEQDGFLGPMFLIGLGLFIFATARRWQVGERLLAAWVLMMTLLAMGDFLLVTAHLTTGIPLPAIIFSSVPILKDIVFDRMMWGVFWGLGLLCALMFSRIESTRLQAAFVLWVACVTVSWWPTAYTAYRPRANPWITSMVRQGVITSHDVLCVFPFDILYNPNNNVLYTQIANHFQYRLAEGYLSPNDAILQHDMMLAAYWVEIQLHGRKSSQAGAYRRHIPHPRSAFHTFLRQSHTDAVVLTPMTHEQSMKNWLIRALGPPSGHVHRTYFWWVGPSR